MKKLKIVNKYKFYRSISVLILLFILVLTFGTNITYSNNNINYREEYIIHGDTIWDISVKELNTNPYFKNKHIRDVINEIKKINNITECNLQIGDKILLPEI